MEADFLAKSLAFQFLTKLAFLLFQAKKELDFPHNA